MAIIVSCTFGCAIDHRPGPSWSARLVTTRAQAESGYSTEMQLLDGEGVHPSRVWLVPGRHRVVVEGTLTPRNRAAEAAMAVTSPAVAAASALGAGKNPLRSGLLAACFVALEGRTYEARTFAEGGVWKVEIVDQTTTYDVKSPCPTGKPKRAAARLPEPTRDPFE